MPYSCKTLITSANELAPREKRLSICLGADGFSFAETSTAGALVSFAVYAGPHASSINQVMTDVKSVFASLGIRPFSFSASDLIVISDENVWVPDELYTATANRKYAPGCFLLEPSRTLIGILARQVCFSYHPLTSELRLFCSFPLFG